MREGVGRAWRSSRNGPPPALSSPTSCAKCGAGRPSFSFSATPKLDARAHSTRGEERPTQ
eukprot:1533587-Prymnesium_polylepis.2